MLQVGIHDHHAVARHVVESGQHGVLLAKVAREVNVADALIGSSQLFDHVDGAVVAAVVHHDHLPCIVFMSIHEFLQRHIHGGERGFFVVAGNEY